MTDNPFVQFLDDYGPCRSCKITGCEVCADKVIRFFREVLGIEPDPWQYEFIRAYGRGDRGISVKACHGPGKTLGAAGCAWHQCLCRFPQHGVVTAPTKSQLFGAFMKEMKTIHSKLPDALKQLYEVTNDKVVKIDTPAESLFEARTAREEKPEALQGVHCDAGWVLIIVDEASGVHEKIFEAGIGSMSGDRVTTILLSNPTRSSGFFYNTHMKPGVREEWTRISVSADDSPRVTEKFKLSVERQFGRDSNAYRVRVLGEFPKADLDTVIGYELVDSARDRDIDIPEDLREVWGLDVARFGDDENVLIRRSRLHVNPKIMHWSGKNLMRTAGNVKAEWDACPAHLRPDEILVDDIGMGGGVVDRLQELGLPVRGINVGESAGTKEKYFNLRSELWFTGKEWLEKLNKSLPRCPGGCAQECPHEILAMQLVMPRYTIKSNGKTLVEPKDAMKKRGEKSPDFADAFMLTFAGEPATLLHGSSENDWRTSWNQPISRDLGTTLI